ncbi:MAG: DUF1353 domain-containing protein [Hyphomicrobiales bacterium]|nr:DUF1353 domain-containing protein [Hyphomicrobiales bacterium]
MIGVGFLQSSFRGLVCLLLLPILATVAEEEEHGRFIGRVAVEWLDNGDSRNMRLLEEFSYVDQTGKAWTVPEGAVVNGASIPRPFWALIGPPFVGAYRRASVIHDYHCETMSEPWKAVHRMFYEASRAGGVDKVTAKVMYAAIYGGGPRWTEATSDRAGRPRRLPKPDLTEESAEALETWIRSEDPSLDEVEMRVEGTVGSAPPQKRD